MDTLHLNTYLHLIEALLQCAKGEEWLLLQQHEDLIDAELISVMEQVSEQLKNEGNLPAAKILYYWTVQLTHLLQQNSSTEALIENRSQNYLKLIQTILQCEKGDEVAILNQHPDLMDEGLVYMMNQVAAQLAAKGDSPKESLRQRDTAIYLKHLAAEVNRVLLHPGEVQPKISSPQTNNHVKDPASQEVPIAKCSLEQVANKLPQNERQSSVQEAAPTEVVNPSSKSAGQNNDRVNGSIDPAVEITKKRLPDLLSTPTSPQFNNHIEESLENISSRLEKLEISINKTQNPSNPLWYMSILEQAAAQAWIVSSEEIEQLIGTKPHCAPDRNSFVRGCWKFEKAGKVGMYSSWRVFKEILTSSMVGVGIGDSLPLDTASASTRENPLIESTKLELDLSSPWAENSGN